MKATDNQEYDIWTDPTEYKLFRAFSNDIIDKIIADIELMKAGTGNIKATTAIKICRRYKK